MKAVFVAKGSSAIGIRVDGPFLTKHYFIFYLISDGLFFLFPFSVRIFVV